jgi:hypothetical protein
VYPAASSATLSARRAGISFQSWDVWFGEIGRDRSFKGSSHEDMDIKFARYTAARHSLLEDVEISIATKTGQILTL